MPLEHLPHLFVEGKTDKYVIIQLLKNHGLFAQDGDQVLTNRSEMVKVQLVVKVVRTGDGSSGSKTELLTDLSQRIRAPKHTSVGYIFDADDPTFTEWNLERTWNAVRERLLKPPAVIQSPDSIPFSGFVGEHAKTGTRVGVWLMPDNQRDGDVEDFLRTLIDDNDTIAPFAETSTRLAKDDHGAQFGPKDFKKAVIQAWLAWQEEPGMTFGTAFQKDCLKKKAPLAEMFVSWVRNLIASSSRPVVS